MRRALPFFVAAALLALACGLGAFPPEADAGFRTFRRPSAGGPASRSTIAAGLFVFQPTAPASGSQCTGATLASTDGGTMTFTRATVATCTKQDGTVVALTSGQPALQADGVLIEPAATNSSKWSAAVDQWTTKTATVIAADTTVGPDGLTAADSIASNDTNTRHKVAMSVGNAGSANYVHSCYMKPAEYTFAGVGLGASAFEHDFNLTSCTTTNANGAPNSGYTVTIDSAPNGFCRYGMGHSDAAGASQLVVLPAPSHALFGSGFVGDAGTTIAWGCQSETGLYATSYIPTPTSANVTRNAVTLTLTTPLASADTTWNVRARVAPNAGTWLKGNTSGLWSIGAGTGAANSADAKVDTTGALVVNVHDATATAKTWTSTLKLSDGQHDIRVQNAAGTITVYDGADALAGSTSGSGTGIITTMPGTTYLGSLGTGSQLTGRLMDACISNAAGGCASAAAAELSFASAGAGEYTNGFGYEEPEWCVRAGYTGSGEIMGAGTAGTANTWTLTNSGGTLTSVVRDALNAARTRITYASVGTPSTVRLCSVRGEQFLFADDVPVQLTNASLIGTGGPTATSNGSSIIRAQPATIRITTGTPCFSRSVGICGSRPNLVAVLGDSLSTGPGGPTTPWPQGVDGLLGSTWGVYNYAIGSTTAVNLLNVSFPMMKHSRMFRYVVMMIGLNEIAGGTTGATAWTNQQAVIAAAQAAGATVVLVTPTPWKYATTTTWTAGKQTHYDTLLTSMRGAGLAYYDANPVFAKAGDVEGLEPSYNIATLDGVHLNQAAHTIISAAVAALTTP